MSKISFKRFKQVGVICPDTIFVKMRAMAIRTLVSGGTGSVDEFTINSLNDSGMEVGATLDRPLGYDQWVPFYTHYEVRANKVKLRVTNNVQGTITATLNSNVAIGIYPGEVGTIVSGEDAVYTQPYCKWITIAPIGSSNQGTLRNYISVKKIVGRQIDGLNYTGRMDTSVGAGDGTGPASEYSWFLFYFNLNGTTGINVSVVSEMTYYVRLWGRKNFQSSEHVP